MLLSFLLLPMFSNGDLNLQSDQALQQKVSLSLKAVPILDAATALGKATGTDLDALAVIRDLKVNVFCTDEPAANVMQSLASVLDCEWKANGSGYRLEIDDEKRKQREAYEVAELRLMREQVEKGLTPFRRLAPSTGSAPASNIPDREKALHEAMLRDAGAVNLGRMLAGFSSADWNAFWKGDVRTYAPMEGGSPTQPAVPNEAQRIIGHYDPFLCSFECNIQVPQAGRNLKATKLVVYPKPPSELSTMPFARSVAEWTKGSTAPRDERLAKSFVAVQPPRGGEYYVPSPTLADQLEAFHKGTGFPVVSDAFSIPVTVTGGSGQALIGSLAGAGYFHRFDGGVLSLRHPGFWRLRKPEIPAHVLSQYAKRAEEEPLTMQNYLSFAARLTPEQASALSLPNAVVLPFDPRPLTRMGPAMAFYSKLSPAQRTQSNSGLAAAQLGRAEAQAFVSTLLMGSLMGYGKGNYFGRAISGNLDQLGVLASEESSESTRKKRDGKPYVKARTFRIYVGSRAEFIRYEAEAKAPAPKE